MKKSLFLLITLVIATLLLGGCAAPTVEDLVEEVEATPEKVEEAVEEAPAEEEMAEEEAPAEEEMAEEEMVEPAGEADLDAAFTSALDGMTGYWITQVDALAEQLAEGNVFLLDVRENAELEETGYIEGAVHIPLRELAQHTDLLPGFDTPIVVYCKSGFRGALATAQLNALGWDARDLAGGIVDWMEAGNPTVEGMPAAEPLNAAEVDPALLAAVDANLSSLPEGWGVVTVEALAEELAESDDLVLIDVRRPDEVLETGMIEGATNVPLETFVADHSLWPESKDANIVIYCKSGTRGAYAMSILRTYGYTNVRNLTGGIVGWIDAGNPVAGGLDGNYGAFLSSMEGYQQISPEALAELLAEAPDTFMIDVRNVDELEEAGYIEGAINIPLAELAQHTDLLPAFDTPIVVYCKAGTRGAIGMMSLVGMGYTDVRNLSGGFDAWVEAGNAKVDGVPEAEALNAEEFDPAVLALVDTTLTTYEGWGQVQVEALAEELAEDPEAIILVDVRRPDEVAEVGVIEGAISIPLEELISLKAEWPAKDANIVVYCKSGTRGTMAMAILRMFGYTNVRNLVGGITGWTDAGNPVVPYE